MKTCILILALVLVCGTNVPAEEKPAIPTLALGVYYTFQPIEILLHNRYGKEEILRIDRTDDFKKIIYELVQNADTALNSFFPQKIIYLQLAYVRYRGLPDSLTDADEFFSALESVEKQPADLILIVIRSELYVKGLSSGGG